MTKKAISGHDEVPTLSDYSDISDKRFKDGHRGSTESGKPKSRPSISVVTITYNAQASLRRTIQSVITQVVPGELEYIIVDGGSSDGTLAIIREYDQKITYWTSGKDRGISDAFNKGIALTTGKYVAIVNADDWLSGGQLAAGIACLEATGAGFCFGDLIYHSENGEIHRIVGDDRFARRLRKTMPALNHPTVIVRREVYERYGLFRLNYRRAMDYDLLLRFVSREVHGSYDPSICGNMSLGGISDKTWIKSLVEVRQIAISFGRSPAVAWFEFYGRVLKGWMRRKLEVFPAGKELRRWWNRSYRPL
jgi:glycosyltransferase involved in cell wall biosynthesis